MHVNVFTQYIARESVFQIEREELTFDRSLNFKKFKEFSRKEELK